MYSISSTFCIPQTLGAFPAVSGEETGTLLEDTAESLERVALEVEALSSNSTDMIEQVMPCEYDVTRRDQRVSARSVDVMPCEYGVTRRDDRMSIASLDVMIGNCYRAIHTGPLSSCTRDQCLLLGAPPPPSLPMRITFGYEMSFFSNVK